MNSIIGRARCFWLALLLPFVWSLAAIAVCEQPQPRLLRAEYSQSDAVVIAHLVESQHIVPKNDLDYHLYTFAVEKTLRGTIPKEFVLWDENSSARIAFDVLRGRQYLLFVSRWRDKEKPWWTADGCGHSGEVSKRLKTLKQIERIRLLRGARITGEVTAGSEPVANAKLIATNKSSGKRFETETHADGRFAMDVPAGEYSVTARAAGTTFVTDWLSYEDAESVKLEEGGCAQIEFAPSDSSATRRNPKK